MSPALSSNRSLWARVASTFRAAFARRARAAQVAHDLRSPLAALDFALSDLSSLPAERQRIVRAALGRLHGIAGKLADPEAAGSAPGILRVAAGAVVVVADDDPCIHELWEERFRALVGSGALAPLLHFTRADRFAAWARGLPADTPLLALVDHEFAGETLTGLAAVSELGLAKSAVLVTSRSADASVREGCERLGLALLPKALAGSVAIVMPETGRTAAPPDAAPAEAILIDDEVFVREVWEVTAADARIGIRTFATGAAFLAAASGVDLRTPVYVDRDLADGEDGLELSRRIKELGFEEVSLATGYTAAEIGEAPWLTRVIGKNPPWLEPCDP